MNRKWLIITAFTLAAAIGNYPTGHTFNEGDHIDEETYNDLSEEERVNCQLVEDEHTETENEEAEDAGPATHDDANVMMEENNTNTL